MGPVILQYSGLKVFPAVDPQARGNALTGCMTGKVACSHKNSTGFKKDLG